jgi:hypothetical protein
MAQERGMRRIIAVEPGDWIILPCLLEDDSCYRRVDVYPDGRVEPSDEARFGKTDIYGSDYRRFAEIYLNHSQNMLFLRRPLDLSPQGSLPRPRLKRLAALALKSLLVEV